MKPRKYSSPNSMTLILDALYTKYYNDHINIQVKNFKMCFIVRLFFHSQFGENEIQSCFIQSTTPFFLSKDAKIMNFFIFFHIETKKSNQGSHMYSFNLLKKQQ
jgi:hypothetical protein